MVATSNSRKDGKCKTYKREAAAAVLALWSVITVKLFWYTTPELVIAFNGPYSTLSMAMMGIVGAAFGLEWFSTQSPWKNPSNV